jgi:hypothetical protein
MESREAWYAQNVIIAELPRERHVLKVTVKKSNLERRGLSSVTRIRPPLNIFCMVECQLGGGRFDYP